MSLKCESCGNGKRGNHERTVLRFELLYVEEWIRYRCRLVDLFLFNSTINLSEILIL